MFFSTSPREDADFESGQSIITKNGSSWLGRRQNDWSLILALEGQGEIISDGIAKQVPKGVLTIMSPGHTRKFCAGGYWNILWFHFLKRSHIPDNIFSIETGTGIWCIQLPHYDFLRMSLLLREAHTLDLERGKGWHSLAYNIVENVLLRAGLMLDQNELRLPAGIIRAQKILSHSQSIPDMNNLAASCGMSRSSFYSLFKQVCGASPRVYREIIALRHAQGLLENNGISISEIAERTGFSNIYYFSSRFKKFAGMSPSDYRRKYSVYH